MEETNPIASLFTLKSPPSQNNISMIKYWLIINLIIILTL